MGIKTTVTVDVKFDVAKCLSVLALFILAIIA